MGQDNKILVLYFASKVKQAGYNGLGAFLI